MTDLRQVFITGADGGLGLAFTRRFLDEGWRVFAGQYAAGSALDAVVNARLTVVPLDVRSLDSVTRARRIVADATDRLDLLINNAGVNTAKDTVLEDLDFEVVAAVINTNAIGPLRVTQQFVGFLERGELKRIVNVSSEAGSLTDCRRTAWYAYCMSKAALNMQSRLLQNYLGARGITVLAVHPGWMRSGMGAAVATYAPEESAASLYPLITGPRAPGAPMYFQWDGRPLPW